MKPFVRQMSTTAALFTVLALSACMDSATLSTSPENATAGAEEAYFDTSMKYLLFKEYGEEEDRYRAFPIPGIRNFRMTPDEYDGTEEEEGRVRQVSVALKAYNGKPARRSTFWVRYVDYVLALDLLRVGGVGASETPIGTSFTPDTIVAGSEINPDSLRNEDVGPWVRILSGPGAGHEDHLVTEDVWPISLLTEVEMDSRSYGDTGSERFAIRQVTVRIMAVPGWGKGSVSSWVHWRDWAVAYLQLRAADFDVDVGSDLPG